MQSTLYAVGFYPTTASFCKAKSSLTSAVERSISQPSPVPTSFSATGDALDVDDIRARPVRESTSCGVCDRAFRVLGCMVRWGDVELSV